MTSKYIPKFRRLPPPISRPETDWPAVLNFLISRGFPKKRLADYTGMTRERIYSVLAGRLEPLHSEGQLLLTLHAQESKPRDTGAKWTS